MFKKLHNILSPAYVAEHPELQAKHFLVYGAVELVRWAVLIVVFMFAYYLLLAFAPDIINALCM